MTHVVWFLVVTVTHLMLWGGLFGFINWLLLFGSFYETALKFLLFVFVIPPVKGWSLMFGVFLCFDAHIFGSSSADAVNCFAWSDCHDFIALVGVVLLLCSFLFLLLLLLLFIGWDNLLLLSLFIIFGFFMTCLDWLFYVSAVGTIIMYNLILNLQPFSLLILVFVSSYSNQTWWVLSLVRSICILTLATLPLVF